MAELVTLIVASLKSGSLYAIIGLGYVVIYLATGAINFAQGEFVVFGGMLAAALAAAGVPLVYACVIAVGAAAALGWLTDRALIRPLGAGSAGRIVLVTIGLSVLLRQLFMRAFGPDELPMAPLVPGGPISILGSRVDVSSLVIIALCAVLFSVAWWWFRRTRTGKAMVAAAQSPEGAQLVGVRIQSLTAVAFVIAAAVGALAGIAVTPVTQMAFDSGVGLGIKGFTVAIFGGLTNPLGAIGAGIIIGALETVTAAYFDPTYKDAVALIVLIVVLIFKPGGLFAGRSGERKG